MNCSLSLSILAATGLIVAVSLAPRPSQGSSLPLQNPASWGSDHVGKPVPEFQSGDECLFCHRNEVGSTWAKNRHGQTVRDLSPALPALARLGRSAEGAAFVLGGERRQRFLKPGKEFGTLELLSASWIPPRDGKESRLVDADSPHWDSRTFGDRCAGCHATGVDSTKRTFATRSLDCFACHGEVPEEHTKNGTLALLGKKRKIEARVVTSACAQCHLRTGKSKTSGLPYPNNFVPGDNLFRDFQVDLSDAALAALNPGDRHVYENVRDVALFGKEDVTCLSCHAIHAGTARRHHRVPRGAICANCHPDTLSFKVRKEYEVHSPLCGY